MGGGRNTNRTHFLHPLIFHSNTGSHITKKVPDAMGVKNADLNLAYIVFLPAALLYKTPPRHIWSFSVQRKKKHFGREREVFLLYLSTSFGFQNQTPIPSF